MPVGDTASETIDDFVHSDWKGFKGKSKQERIRMALGAYYNKFALHQTLLNKYNDNHDEHGRFSSGGGESEGGKTQRLEGMVARATDMRNRVARMSSDKVNLEFEGSGFSARELADMEPDYDEGRMSEFGRLYPQETNALALHKVVSDNVIKIGWTQAARDAANAVRAKLKALKEKADAYNAKEDKFMENALSRMGGRDDEHNAMLR